MKNLSKTLSAPIRPKNISSNAQWLAGEGAGSWFDIIETEQNDIFRVIRFSNIGQVECTNLFSSSNTFNLNNKFTVTYPSHCAKISIIQNHKTIQLRH
jgi:hypothetical protein